MNAIPYAISPHEPTKKQLWLAAFTSLLCRMDPEEAVKAADKALELSDERWKEPGWVWTWQFKHNYSVGHRFPKLHNPADDIELDGPNPEDKGAPGQDRL